MRSMLRQKARSIRNKKIDSNKEGSSFEPLYLQRSKRSYAKLIGRPTSTRNHSNIPEKTQNLLDEVDELVCKYLKGSSYFISKFICHQKYHEYRTHVWKLLPSNIDNYIYSFLTFFFEYCTDLVADCLKGAHDYRAFRSLVPFKMDVFKLFSHRRISQFLNIYSPKDLNEVFLRSVLGALFKNVIYIIAESNILLENRRKKEGRFVFQWVSDKICDFIDEFGKHESKIQNVDFNEKTYKKIHTASLLLEDIFHKSQRKPSLCQWSAK